MPAQKIIMTIYKILLLHHGPVPQFTLSVPELGSCPEIDQLILFLSRNGIEELTLHIGNGDFYKLPFSFFTCLQLRHFSLTNCHLSNLPPTFNGFGRLVTLEITDCNFDEILFESLVSRCLLLESLTLQSATRLGNLKIDAPNLNFLCIRADLECFCFKNTPLLVNVSISNVSDNSDANVSLSNVSDDWEDFEVTNTPDIDVVFGCLPLIEKLHLGYDFMKFLIVGHVPERLFCTLDYLKVLQLDEVGFGDMDEAAFALCLIRSSPNLEKIDFGLFIYEFEDADQATKYLADEIYSDFTLNQLRVVHIKSLSGSMPEMNFIKLLLAKSSMLETMLIEFDEDQADVTRILRELARFRRASPKAEIIFEDEL